MMSRWKELLTLKVIYHDPLTSQRAQGLLYFLAGMTLLLLVFDVYQVISMIQVSVSPGPDLVFPLFIPLLTIVFFVMVRYGYYFQTALGLVALSLFSLVLSLFSGGGINQLTLVFPILSAGVLLSWRSTIITAVLVVAMLIGATAANLSGGTFTAAMGSTLSLIIITAWLIVFGTNIQNTAQQFITEFGQLRQITKHLHLSGLEASEAQVGLETINLIRDQLNFTFVSIYLIEGIGVAQRILGGLNLQQINVDRDVQLALGSAISEAIQTKKVVHVTATSSEVLRQHLLQGTQAAVAIPIIEQEVVIGVLDVQSEDLKSFSENEIETVSLIASQLGLAISHARLINSLRGDLEKQNEMMAQQRERLQNYERSERRITTTAWTAYLQQRGIEYMGFDLKDRNIETALIETMNDDLKTAIQTGDISVVQESDYQVVHVPIRLREQSLGAMSFRVPYGSQPIGLRQQELIRSVVQRLAMALENKRLFEQSQSQAQRERKANEVGNLLLSSTDIETVLQLAAKHFNEAMGAIQTQIHLRPETSEIVEGEERR
jgi:GAF domain-containing protein